MQAPKIRIDLHLSAFRWVQHVLCPIRSPQNDLFVLGKNVVAGLLCQGRSNMWAALTQRLGLALLLRR